jgi:hypothetical protein
MNEQEHLDSSSSPLLREVTAPVKLASQGQRFANFLLDMFFLLHLCFYSWSYISVNGIVGISSAC